MKVSGWTILSSRRVKKQIERLPYPISEIFEALKVELEITGKAGDGWPKSGKLWQHGKTSEFKVHLNSNRPIYVVVYEVSKKEKIVKVTYAGTHEKAPYGR